MTQLFRKIGTTDIRNILAVLYVTMVLVYIYVLVFKPVPPENKDLVNIIGGNVIGGLGIVLGYYFGASKKDTPKDKAE
jgi:hypothetical protein